MPCFVNIEKACWQAVVAIRIKKFRDRIRIRNYPVELRLGDSDKVADHGH